MPSLLRQRCLRGRITALIRYIIGLHSNFGDRLQIVHASAGQRTVISAHRIFSRLRTVGASDEFL